MANNSSDICFTHPHESAYGDCSYCKASYCATCMSTIGDNKELICENCFATLSANFYASMVKRKKFMFIGYGLMILSFYIVVRYYQATAGNLAIFAILFLGALTLLTKKRIGEMKLFLKTREKVK